MRTTPGGDVDFDARIEEIDLEIAQADRANGLRWFGKAGEFAGYLVGACALVGAVAGAFLPSNVPIISEGHPWNLVGLGSLSVSALALGVAISIFRVQARRAVIDSLQTERADTANKKLLAAVASNAEDAAKHSKFVADQFVEEMAEARVASAIDEPGDLDEADGVDQSGEGAQLSTGPEAPEAEDSQDVISIPGDGEYRRPGAIPLGVIADLVSWWRRPEGPSGRWTVGNLVGAYRRFNEKGKLTGAPWIVTFRRTSGEQAEYRVVYGGRKPAGSGPTVARFSAEEQRWVDGSPASRGQEGDGAATDGA